MFVVNDQDSYHIALPLEMLLALGDGVNTVYQCIDIQGFFVVQRRPEMRACLKVQIRTMPAEHDHGEAGPLPADAPQQIGRASCRERV